jgi:hypothetical protein
MSNSRRLPPRRDPARAPLPRPQTVPFDLDAVETDGGRELYRFTTSGEEFTLISPNDVEYHDALEADPADLVENLRLMMGDDQYERFDKHKIKIGKLTALARDAQEYYGVGEGNA